MSNYAIKKELEDATGVDTTDFAAKNDFIDLKAEVDKLDINTLVNVPTGLNNLKTKILASTQRPGTSHEVPLKFPKSATSRGPLGDS